MARSDKPILGVHAPRARPTVAGAFWLAALVTVPVALVGITIELALRWLF